MNEDEVRIFILIKSADFFFCSKNKQGSFLFRLTEKFIKIFNKVFILFRLLKMSAHVSKNYDNFILYYQKKWLPFKT
jgi:hypothetical protein